MRSDRHLADVEVTAGWRAARSGRKLERIDAVVLAGLILLCGLIAAFVNPIGDFPLNDDWAYSLPVKWLLESGELRFADWQSHPLITQVLWGSLFALPTGFSFSALRFSTLVLAALGVAATHLAAREAGLARRESVAMALLLAINPLFVSLSHTFMSDVPNLSLGIISLALLLHGISNDRPQTLWAGWAILLLASLIRQPTLAIAIAAAAATGIQYGLSWRFVRRGMCPAVILIVSVVVLYPKIVQATIGLPGLYYERSDSALTLLRSIAQLQLGALKPTLRSIGYGLMNLGFWMLPLLMLELPRIAAMTRRWGKASMGAVVLASGIATAVLVAARRLMPLGDPGNILLDFGAGVRTLQGEAPRAPEWLWAFITGMAAFGAMLIVLALVRVGQVAASESRQGGLRMQWVRVFLVSAAVLYYAPASLNYGAWFDRFTLPMMVILAILIGTLPAVDRDEPRGGRAGPVCTTLAAVLALLYVGFAVASTHDYLDWNRVRWVACRELVESRGASLESLDCGFEFNNLMWRQSTAKPRVSEGSIDRAGARYVVAHGPIEGHRPGRILPCNPWLPYAIQDIYVLERTAR